MMVIELIIIKKYKIKFMINLLIKITKKFFVIIKN